MNEIATLDLTADQARRLTERIRLTAHTFAESRTKLIELVEEAKAGNAHAALGYASWTAYLSDVLGDEPLRLARDDRKELVGILSAEGMSTRAIAPIVGVSQRQVADDVTPEQKCSPDRKVSGMDGKTYTPKADVIRVDTNTGEVIEPTSHPKPRRRPITDTAHDTGWELRKVVERLQRITADDRYAANKEQVAAHLRSHLSFTVEVCQDLLNQINQPQED